jgi:hypothetical protein
MMMSIVKMYAMKAASGASRRPAPLRNVSWMTLL